MYCLGYNASIVLTRLTSCPASPDLQPPQRNEATRRYPRRWADILGGANISAFLIPDSLPHRLPRGELKSCSDFVTDMNSQADQFKTRDTIL